MTSRRIFRCVMLGAPGSGKGTISNRLIKQFHLNYIASGDILRRHVEMNSPLGREAKKYMQDGQLVPEKLVTKCILDKINAIGNDSWLIDGYPRTIEQAEILWMDQEIDAVLNLMVPHDIIISRVKGRWVHPASGRVYNIGFNEPRTPFTDDVTGEPLEQRIDDRPETVRKRLDVYEKITKPVIDYYTDKNILTNFTGNTSDEIWPNVKKFISEKLMLNVYKNIY